MRALFDLNFLVAFLDPGHDHHRRAQDWWSANAELGWATYPLTENGFVRILSRPVYPNQLQPFQAAALLRAATKIGDHRFFPDLISLRDDQLFDLSAVRGHNQLTDIYLLGLAVACSARLITFDRSLHYAGARSAEGRHLVIV